MTEKICDRRNISTSSRPLASSDLAWNILQHAGTGTSHQSGIFVGLYLLSAGIARTMRIMFLLLLAPVGMGLLEIGGDERIAWMKAFASIV